VIVVVTLFSKDYQLAQGLLLENSVQMGTDIGSPGGGNKMNTSVETFAPTVATAALGLPLCASGETGLTRTKPKDLGQPWTPNLAEAFHWSRAAQREERNGFNYTAAMKWRNAAKLFAPDTQAVEYCWQEWERIMQLPRRLAGPAYAAPTISRVI
jgi:hypothetical protein